MPAFVNSKSVYAAGSFLVLGAAFGVLLYRRKVFRIWRRELNLPAIHVVSNTEQWCAVAEKLKEACRKTQVLGVDCEWKAQTVKGSSGSHAVALLQLASADDCCVLVRLNKLAPHIPEDLKLLLRDKRILKVGVAVNDDSRKLKLDHDLVLEGCLDLRHLVDRIPKYAQLERKGLKSLAKSVADVQLKKLTLVRLSDWEIENLTPAQIKYAAEDAVVSAVIFKHLMSSVLLSWPKRLIGKELGPDELYKGALDLVGHLIDHRYRASVSPAKNHPNSKPPALPSKQQTRAYSTRRNPLYHNCQLQAPDGEVLCACARRKAMWYMEKNLGVLISEDPLIVRLKSDPSGRPTFDNKYYVEMKENQCVVCGRRDSLVRKIIVPHEYRRHFPHLMKNHLSHDVLLMCSQCHLVSNYNDSLLRQQLVELCDAPLSSGRGAKTKDDPQLKKVKSAGRALLNSKAKIPEARMEELINVLKDFYQVSVISEGLVQLSAGIDTSIDNENYVVHGEKVVQYVSTHEGLLAFESRWRKHFLDTMKPKFMPNMWSVDHNHQRLALQVTTKKYDDFDVRILGPLPTVTDEDIKECL